jgi:branched-chain amino acid transport system permease protein
MTMVASFAFLTSIDFWIGVGILAAVYGIAALGVQLNLGSTGILNFGQAGFMSIGAYSMGILVVKEGFSLWLAVLIGVGAAVVAGVLVGLPSLRLRADYFAITTLAFAEIVRYVVDNSRGLTGGHEGIIGYDAAWREASQSMSHWFDSIGIHTSFLFPLLVVSWATFLALAFLLRALTATPWGRVLNAIRSDEDAARALGKNTLVYKLQSLGISAAVAALAGYVLALDLALLVPEEFDNVVTIFAYVVVILGGLRSYLGVVAGSVVLLALLEGTRFVNLPFTDERIAALRFMIVGFVLIVLVAFRPQGAFGKRQEMVLGD